MQKFMLIIREDLKRMEELRKEMRNQDIQEMVRWIEGLSQSGHYAHGEPLTGTGAFVSKDNIATDGPFIEAKESISGYIMVNAESLAQATSIAQTCPVVLRAQASVEVRPILVY
jgi:hypothetical protein